MHRRRKGAHFHVLDILGVAYERPRVQRRFRDRLGVLPQRKLLDEALHDLERLAVAAQTRELDRLSSDRLEVARAAFENRRRSRYTAGGKLCGEQRIAIRIR